MFEGFENIKRGGNYFYNASSLTFYRNSYGVIQDTIREEFKKIGWQVLVENKIVSEDKTCNQKKYEREEFRSSQEEKKWYVFSPHFSFQVSYKVRPEVIDLTNKIERRLSSFSPWSENPEKVRTLVKAMLKASGFIDVKWDENGFFNVFIPEINEAWIVEVSSSTGDEEAGPFGEGWPDIWFKDQDHRELSKVSVSPGYDGLDNLGYPICLDLKEKRWLEELSQRYDGIIIEHVMRRVREELPY